MQVGSVKKELMNVPRSTASSAADASAASVERHTLVDLPNFQSNNMLQVVTSFTCGGQTIASTPCWLL